MQIPKPYETKYARGNGNNQHPLKNNLKILHQKISLKKTYPSHVKLTTFVQPCFSTIRLHRKAGLENIIVCRRSSSLTKIIPTTSLSIEGRKSASEKNHASPTSICRENVAPVKSMLKNVGPIIT